MKTWLRYSVLSALCLAMATHSSANGRGVLDTLTELGPRPYYLVEQMSDGPLKKELSACADRRGQFKPSIWSIGHRGAPLQFPEHTKESYEAAARMGAGILECDVTFTKDRELVCRHAQCDLHTTTNIVATPLAQKCTVPPQLDADGVLLNAADIRCCTSDITLAEFKSLDGKMDAANRSATSIDEYLDATAGFRTDLYTGGERGTLISHAESIELFRSLGVGMTPELKSPEVAMPYEGDYSQEDYAQQLLDEYRAANIPPFAVWPQSFNLGDVRYWIDTNPEFGKQAVFLDSRYGVDVNDPDAVAALEPNMQELADSEVKILAPPMFMMLGLDESNDIIASDYALAARSAGLDLIGWTTERSGQLENGGGGFYYSTVADAINNDGDILTVIDALAQKVGIIGLFSDWPATTTFYANCKPTAKARRR